MAEECIKVGMWGKDDCVFDILDGLRCVADSFIVTYIPLSLTYPTCSWVMQSTWPSAPARLRMTDVSTGERNRGFCVWVEGSKSSTKMIGEVLVPVNILK